ncbi:hypothetical protein [Winogradskyella sp. PE311]|uniref:hypothetical protein n=1 Tax=Winogradskyella sp. PE311 TaxID=3366943 RepID=UPI00397F2EA8
MKLTKNSNVLLIGLSLILSLVAFTGVANQTPNEAIKTALVVGNHSNNISFSINYNKANKLTVVSSAKYTDYVFIEFQKNYSITAISAFKSYIYKTLGLRTSQLHTKGFTFSTHQIVYNDLV